MSDRTAVPERVSKRARTARRGGPSGRLVVGEYVGQVAADAAQAVRRAGLRPGLDRSFGCEPELTGLVVAQEPVAGEDLARNGMVTLYVAAPGNAPLNGDTDTIESLDDVPASAPVTPEQVEIEQADTASIPARARRRRKPGLAARAAPIFGPAPAPALPDRGPADEAPTAELVQADPALRWDLPDETYTPDGEDFDEGALDGGAEDGLSHEEFVVHADDVFAGRAGGLPAWRRVYPRRHMSGALGGGRGVRGQLAEHPRLVKIVGAGLAAWLAVGVASALDGHHARTRTVSVVSGISGPAETHAGTYTTRAGNRTPAPRLRTVRPVLPLSHARTSPRHSSAAPRHPLPAPVRATAAPPEGAGVQGEAAHAQAPVTSQSSAPPSPASPASASALPPPAQEQTQGGPFSP